MAREKKKPGVGRVILRVLLGLLAAILVVALVMVIVPLTEGVDKTPVPGSADWMAALPDETPINQIVLPGTHDSATQYVQLAFFSKCQGLDIPDQLAAGYRYLDIRLGVDEHNDIFKLMHGFTSCKTTPPALFDLYLDDLLRGCYAFLTDHPTETVVFAVKFEHGDRTIAEVQRMLDAYIREDPDFWLLTDTLPTLGEARGKLVLLRRWEDEAGLGAAAGIPLLWSDQKGSNDVSLDAAVEPQGNYTLLVQDRFEYSAADKWAAFTRGMEQAAGRGDGDLAIHFLSTKGTAAYGHPYKYAKALNPRLLALDGLDGWIVVDFASARLAEHIYSANF